MQFNRKNYTNETLINLYKAILKPRLIEEKMFILLRQNKISKWFSGIGQEAISAGVAMALESEEWIFPVHRNLAVFTSRDMPIEKLYAQWQGKNSGYSKGRERSFHFGSKEHHICGMISHLGAQLAVADGVALASVLSKQYKATVAFCGDGATSEGDFHEAVNLAAVWNLPIIFVIENNGYGLSTPNSEQFKCYNLIDKAPGYGIDALQIDGNNILEVYDAITQLSNNIRNNPRPVLVEALTFRMRGHEESSGIKYVPEELFEKWAQKDPIENFEKYLLKEFVLNNKLIEEIKSEIHKELELAIEKIDAEPYPIPNNIEEMEDVYAPYSQKVIFNDESAYSEKRMVDAISDALSQSMELYPNLILMGQDIAEYGGVFKATQGLSERFGKERVRNTPICESAIIGTALGLSIRGFKSVVEMQFADFVTNGFNQLVNNLAKSHYRWGQHADVVIRMPTGAGVGAGPFHSQSTEAWFFRVPGLKIVYSSNAMDAKGLLNAAIEDPNPVLFFEHKAMYRNMKESIPDDYYTTEIGKAQIVRDGSQATIITYGMGVYWAKEAAEELNMDLLIIDLRTLLPWDQETVKEAIKKTGKGLILTEDTITGSIASEIAAWISEHCFEYLDAPVVRVGALDTPVPFSTPLEENFLPKTRLKEKLKELMNF